MSAPGKQVQGAIVAALRSSAAVATICGSRIFDRVPADPTFPYIAIGEEQLIDDGNSCFDAYEVFVTLQCWSRAVGKTQAKDLAATVIDALNQPLAVTGFTCVEGHFRDASTLTERDGLTERTILTFRYLLDPA